MATKAHHARTNPRLARLVAGVLGKSLNELGPNVVRAGGVREHGIEAVEQALSDSQVASAIRHDFQVVLIGPVGQGLGPPAAEKASVRSIALPGCPARRVA